MRFPGYVPSAARTYITQRIEGSQPACDGPATPRLRLLWLQSHEGLASKIAKTTRSVAELDRQILATNESEQQEQLVELKEHRAILHLQLDSLKETRDLLERFAIDERMHGAYSHLIRDFIDEDSWSIFFNAALEARADFASERTTMKRAAILAGKIAKTAALLAQLLSEFEELEIFGPEVFSNPPGLLNRDSLDVVQHLEQQRVARLAENGLYEFDLRSEVAPPDSYSAEGANPAPSNFLDLLFESSQNLQTQEYLRPSTVDIINNIATAAHNYTPAPLLGASAAAIQSKKNNRKTQYTRAFWYIFSNKRFGDQRIRKTPDLMHAIAITATVVFNGRDDDVSYDDVRKALEDRSKATLKNIPARRKIRRPKKH